MPIQDLSPAVKDTTRSCVFDYPDRPVRPIPPINEHGETPADYPYNPQDDWNPPPLTPPYPGDDPDAVNHPLTWKGVFISTVSFPAPWTNGDTTWQLVNYKLVKWLTGTTGETILDLPQSAIDTSITGLVRNSSGFFQFYAVGIYYISGAVNPPGPGPYYYPVGLDRTHRRPPSGPNFTQRSFTIIDGQPARSAAFQTVGVSLLGFTINQIGNNYKFLADGRKAYNDWPPLP